MCIIACKPYGISTIDHELLKRCFENNPDGAGFAFCVKGDKAVRYRKGFMSFKAFQTSLDKLVLSRYNLADVQLLLHYRITTHGGTRQENTHPFPISASEDKLQALKGRTDVICAMNGIVSVDIPKDSTMSDTMHFIKESLSFPKSLRSDFYKAKHFPEWIAKTGAKWAFMDTENIHTFGTFNVSEGWTYSNYSYEDYSVWNYGKYYAPIESHYYDHLVYRKSEFSLGNCVPVNAKSLEFVGVVVTDEGSYVEVDYSDEVYMNSDNKLYQYDYEDDCLYEIINAVGIYDVEFIPINYDRLYEKISGLK
jgi:hypothetical protein